MIEFLAMAQTFHIADFLVTAADPLTVQEQDVLVYSVSKARVFVDQALLQTIQALQVETQCVNREEAASHLPADLLIHVEANFRTGKSSNQLFAVLHRMQGLLLKLSAGMHSGGLHFKEYGLEYFEPKASFGAAPNGYVSKTLSEKVQIVSSVLKGGEGKCLNVNLKDYKNDSKIFLDFEKLAIHNFEGATDTVIHECTHKFLASLDNTLDCPWKRAGEYYREWRALKVEPPIPEAWSSLSTEEAVQNAYGLTNYIHYMPADDIALYHQGMMTAERSIGGRSNRTIFNSITNDDL